jgi:hypothetical protein
MNQAVQPDMFGTTENEQAFKQFVADNPRVYREFVRLARLAKKAGATRVGAKAIVEVLRWNIAIKTNDPNFKINNSFVSHLARMAMAREADLEGLFETRRLHA